MIIAIIGNIFMVVLYAFFLGILVSIDYGQNTDDQNIIIRIISTIAHTLSIIQMCIGIYTFSWYYIAFAIMHNVFDLVFICFDNKEDNRHFAIIIFTALIQLCLLGFLAG